MTASYASLLEADPSLATVLGTREATAIGHLPRLPVLALEPGPWTPPAAPETIGYAVLGGLLLSEPAIGLAAPGDVVLGPPDRSWTACTDVRLAVIGDAFREALADRPKALVRLLARAVAPGSWRIDRAPAEQRLEALFWRLATRCGVPGVNGMLVPLALTPAMLARIAGLSEPQCAGALAALESRGRVLRGVGGWFLRAPEPVERAVALHARLAHQHALSRSANAVLLELCADLEARRRGRPR